MNPLTKLFIFGTLLIAIQALGNDAEYRQSACHQFIFKKTAIYLTQQNNRGWLEGLFCERMNPRSASEAFAEGSDMPAELLDLSMTPIKWESESAGPFDLAPLDELNAKAANVWDQLIQCHGLAEKARRAYLDLNPKCGLDRQLKTFSQSVQLYLTSTQTFPIKYQISGKYHPLLTQLLLENAISTTLHPAEGKAAEELHFMTMKMIEHIQAGRTIQEIEAAASGPYYGPYVSFELKNAIKSPATKDLLYRLNRKMNSTLLLSQNISLNTCGSMGLWPGITRAVTASFASDGGNWFLESGKFEDSVLGACGNFRFRKTPYSYNNQLSYEIVDLFRKRAN